MRILHTSDWHLGRALEGHNRQPEQEQFVDEICALAADQAVHLVLIAGDVFDNYNPPAWAEQLFCDALDRLSQSGRRAVAVIAGNHDSPDRLSAVRPLATNQGIVIAGLPLEQPLLFSRPRATERVRALAQGEGWLELAVPGCEHTAILSLLPYPSESRLGRLLSEDLEEYSLRDAYSQMVNEILQRQAAHYRGDTINLAVSHLFVQGGSASDSERPIQVGGACTVAVDHLPAAAQYIALGHLHRPQQLKSAPAPAYYSGSPLAYSFSEANQSKAVYLVDVQPGQAAAVTAIPLQSGIPLERWTCTQGLEEAWQRIDNRQGRPAWVDLEVHVPQPISNQEIARLRQAWPTLINLRPVLPGQELEEREERLATLALPDIFDRFYRRRRNGAAPSAELVQMFVQLADAVALQQDEGQEGGGVR
ncbi:MAG: exonuclease SbcCD subunit D [Bacillota bacterium]